MNFHNDQSAIVRYSLHSVALLGTIQLLRHQKDWVGQENVKIYWRSVHAVSDYKKRSNKTQHWISGKIQEMSLGQVKFKKRMKELKKRWALRFSELRNE